MKSPAYFQTLGLGWLLLSLALSPLAALGQQTPTPTPTQAPAASEPTADESEGDGNDGDEENAAPEAPAAPPPVNPDATFTPTEEISEDKPVAFPVDI